MHTITPTAGVIVPADRQRQSFDPVALLELAASIRERGLFHALQVRPDGTLVTGERRLRAIREHLEPLGQTFTYAGQPVPPGHVPTITVATDDPLVLEEIELEENTVRKDLTWQELAQATARLHHLRDAQKVRASVAEGAAIPVRQTVADTAVEVRGSALGSNHEATRQEIIVAEHLSIPEVAKAKTLSDAMKVIRKKEELSRNARLAAVIGETYSTESLYAEQGSCLEVLTRSEWQGRFDVILTDPPYGMGAHEFGDAAGKLLGTEHHYDDSYESWVPLMQAFCRLTYTITKPQAHAYIFCDIDRFHELKKLMQEAGWYVFRTPFINVKNSGRVPLPTQGPRRQYEIALYAIKGDKPVTAILPDVISTAADEQLGHGAQKPVALYTDLLKRSVRPGDWVLDAFSGSGTIFPAAFELKCFALGIEQNPESYGMGLKRIQALSAQSALPL